MSNSPMPNDPLTAMAEGAAMARELFDSYVAAGFTEVQAIYLVGQILTAGLRPTS